MPVTLNANTSTGFIATSDLSGVMALQTGGTTAMTIDGSGNVGIGTASPIYKLDVTGTFRALVGSVPFIVDGFGAVQAAGGVYVNTSGTRQAGINSSGIDLRFRTGNADDRMIIDSAGNVGIGRTSSIGAGNGVNLELQNATAVRVMLNNTASPNGKRWAMNSNTDGSFSWYDNTGDAERMRIDSNGNVGIGTSSISSAVRLELGSATDTVTLRFRSTSSGFGSVADISCIGTGTQLSNLVFYTRNGDAVLERGRFNAAGYFKASNDAAAYIAAAGSYHEFVQTANSNGIYFRASNASYGAIINYIIADRNTTNSSFYPLAYYNSGASAFRLLVADSGNITNTNGSYGTISDVKNKENIVDATPKLDKVNQLKVRNYNFIGDDLKQIGFVAQELEEVFPNMVEEHQDRDAEGNDLGTTTKTIKTTVLIPILVKAMQELKAELDEAKSEIQALKGAE